VVDFSLILTTLYVTRDRCPRLTHSAGHFARARPIILKSLFNLSYSHDWQAVATNNCIASIATAWSCCINNCIEHTIYHIFNFTNYISCVVIRHESDRLIAKDICNYICDSIYLPTFNIDCKDHTHHIKTIIYNCKQEMKFLKSKSFKSKKKKSTTEEADGTTGVVQSTTEDNVQEQTSAIITPPSSPQAATGDEEGDSQQDNKYYTGPPAAIPPAYPSTPLGLGEPIRVGSFNFDEPTSNGNSNKQTRTLTFPPLYTEADTMIKLSNLIYTLVELRDLARNGVLNNPASSMRILDTPLPLDTAVTIITQEGEMLKEILDDGKHEATLSALESLLARQRESAAAKGSKLAQEKKDSDDNGMFGWMTNWDGCLAGGFSFDELFCGNVGDILGEETVKQSEGDETMSSMITTVNDVKSTEELVYAVGVNPIEERITVIFRGSVTKADFITDSKISIVQAPNPQRYNDTVVDGMPVGGDVGVHQGFYEYLFTEGKKGKPSKYVEIMKHVQKLYKESPTRRNYKLYVTGHSLGGALGK